MSNFNKLITNKPVTLTEQEVANLSETLSAVRTAGGGSGGTYGGDGIDIVITGNNTIALKEETHNKIWNNDYITETQFEQEISSYATKTYTDTKLQTKQDKLTFGYDEDNAISSINGSALAGADGVTGDYYSASNPSGFINADQAEAQILAKKYITSSVSELDNFYSKSQTSGANEIANAIKDFVTEDLLEATSGELKDWVSTNYYNKTETSSKTEIENAFDNIPKYILNGDSNITATSAQDGKNIRWDLAVNATPVVTDTTLTGDKGIYTHTTTNSGEWCVELVQSAYDAINDVQNKLDTTVAEETYQPKGDYVSSTDITDMATKTWVGNQHYLTEVPSEYVTDTELQNTSAAITALIPSTAGLASETDLQIVSAGVDYVSAQAITAHQSLTDYYTKSETSGASELSDEFAKYVTSSNVSTPNTDYVMTTTGWKVLTLPGGGMTQVIHDETLTGQGNDANSKLGVAWSALSGNTINSALSAGSATSALSAYKAASASASKRLQDSTDGPVIQVGDVTALQHWASSNSSTWEGVTAKLGTAQYATDSATFVTSSSNTITGTKQYALTTSGWAEITGGSVGDDYVPYSATNLAIGSDVVASAYSFAQGYDNSANWNSVTFGTHSTAYSRSLAVGENAFADSHSLSIGGGANSHCNSADGQSIAVGNGVSARYRSIAVGSHSTVADTDALSIGGYCVASGVGSVAIGYRNSAYNIFEVGGGQAFGRSLEISGGLAIGYYNATKDAAFVIGDGTGNDDDTVVNRSDSFVIYRDGSVSAKGDISANGVKLGGGSSFTGASANNGLSGNGLTSSPLGLHSSAAKTISATKYEEINTNMLAQKLLVVTSDQQIINYVQGGGANNEGCIFFVTSAHS